MAFRSQQLSRISPKSYRHNAVSNRFSSRFSTSCTNDPRSLSRVKAGTHSASLKESHTAAHTPKQGAFRMGALSLPSERFARFGNPAWPGLRTANFAAFGSWSEALLKDTESLRNSDALMRVAVPRRRGPAGLRCSVCNLVMLLFFTLCAVLSERARQGWHHYPRRALRASETPDGRLSKRLVCRFLRSMGIAPRATPIFLRIYRYPYR